MICYVCGSHECLSGAAHLDQQTACAAPFFAIRVESLLLLFIDVYLLTVLCDVDKVLIIPCHHLFPLFPVVPHRKGDATARRRVMFVPLRGTLPSNSIGNVYTANL